MDNRRVLVDTGIFIKYFRATKKKRTLLYQLTDEAIILTTSVSVYELMIGARTPEVNSIMKEYLEDIQVLSFTETASQKAAEIYHDLRTKNKMIEFRDIFIAAICIVNDMELVTLNRKHFKRIEDLKIYEK